MQKSCLTYFLRYSDPTSQQHGWILNSLQSLSWTFPFWKKSPKSNPELITVQKFSNILIEFRIVFFLATFRAKVQVPGQMPPRAQQGLGCSPFLGWSCFSTISASPSNQKQKSHIKIKITHNFSDFNIISHTLVIWTEAANRKAAKARTPRGLLLPLGTHRLLPVLASTPQVKS